MKIIWDPEIVARATNLHIHARQLVWGYRFGHHRSPKVSRSVEFAEHKEYAAGDPIRDIDWRVYARTERLLVRRQQADTELSLVFVIDASADMALGFQSYPDWEETYFGRAAILVASVAMIAQKRGERIGLFILGGTGFDVHWIPPKSTKNQLIHIINALSATKAKGRANIGLSLEKINEYLPKKSIVYVLSDFMEEPKEWGPSVCVLAAQKIDIRLVHLFSEKEYNFEFDTIGRFQSTEYSDSIALDPQSSRDDFAQIVAEYREEFAYWCGRSSSLYIPAPREYALDMPFMHMIKGIR